MTINGWDIRNALAKQWNVSWGYHEMTNSSAWAAGSKIPVVLPSKIGWKNLKIVLVVKGLAGRETIRENVSLILSKLQGSAEIVLDGFNHLFYGVLKSYTAEEMAMKRWHVLTLNLIGYEYAQQVSKSGTSSLTIRNPGTADSPAILALTSTVGKDSVTITGLGDDIVLTTVPANTQIVVDGETGLITQGTALKDTGIFTLPYLAPGTNIVTCNQSTVTMTVTYKPRYM